MITYSLCKSTCTVYTACTIYKCVSGLARCNPRQRLIIIIMSSCNQMCFLSLLQAVVRTFITPCSFCERLTLVTVTGSSREFVSHRSACSASLCFTWNRLNRSPTVLLQRATLPQWISHHNTHYKSRSYQTHLTQHTVPWKCGKCKKAVQYLLL